MARLQVAKCLEIATALMQRGKLREANGVCQPAVRLHPANSEALCLLGRITFRSGHKNDAIGKH